jgi:hypothetical protein
MAIKEITPGGAIMITGPHIGVARLLSLRGMLQLEIKGLTRRGRSAYSIIKTEFGLRGNREKVLAQFEEIIEKAKVAANATGL